MDKNLTEIISCGHSLAKSIDAEKLKKYTKKLTVHPALITWKKVQHLYILGEYGAQGSQGRQGMRELGLSPGFYVGANNTWVLALCVPDNTVLTYLSSCGAELELLCVHFTPLEDLDLSHLPNLQKLDLSNNAALRRVSGLEKMGSLKELKLRKSVIGPVLELPGLDSLERLDIGFSNICRIHVDRPLPEMRSFSAAGTGIEDLGFLNCFPMLSSLSLSNCSFTHLSPIPLLPELEDLDFTSSDLEELPPLDHLTKLTHLSLTFTSVAPGNDYVFPPHIEFLDLGHINIKRIPESIRHLKNLRALGLYGTHLEDLPDWLPELGLSIGNSPLDQIYLDSATVDTAPPGLFDQPQDVILQWFESRKKAKEQAQANAAKPLNEMKIVFLGDGGAGKTHTIARLLLEGENPDNFDGAATPGIVITDKTYSISGRDIQVHYWDFGGQEILHSMHRMFLTERTLYVVVLNVRDGTQNERARYWLHNIKSFAKDSPVLLVLNQMDQNQNASINENDLRALYPGLTEVVKMSAKTDTADYFRENFMAPLQRQIGSFRSLESPFLLSWSRLKERLQNMKDPYIRGPRYKELSAECGVEDSEVIRKALLNWFNDLGVSFCYGGSAKLEDYVILRPDWITNAIYIILFNRIEAVENGLVSHEAIYRLLQDRSDQVRRVLPGVVYSPEEVEFVLNVVRKFRLSFRVDDDREFIPMLCQSNSLPVAAEYEHDPAALEFRMEYEYLPNNVLHRLMVELRADLDKKNVWLTGARFCRGDTGLSAVVKSEGNLMRIFVRAEKPRYTPDYYLDQIKDALERINSAMGLEVKVCQVVYKSDRGNALFNYDELLFALDCGDAEIPCWALKRKIPIRDILGRTDHRVDQEKQTLLRRIIRACEKLQDNRDYSTSHEDNRTTYIRDILTEHYVVLDQTRGGRSELGENAGELDLAIRREGNIPWTIFEALNLTGKGATQIEYWDRHLKKLLDNYNSNGLDFLFHVSYVTCAKQNFSNFCSTYSDHIRFHSPDSFSLQFCEGIPTAQEGYDPNHFIHAYRCVYDCGGYPTTVYHIFVRLGE